jgi:hypothetical protein
LDKFYISAHLIVIAATGEPTGIPFHLMITGPLFFINQYGYLTPKKIVDIAKIVYLRNTYQLGVKRIKYYLKRSHRIDQEEFHQLQTYTDDVDLNKKLESWEQFYNFDSRMEHLKVGG